MPSTAAANEPTQSAPLQATFKDGLGTRYRWNGAGGPLEILTLRPYLGAIQSFEPLIHERLSRLAQFREGCYAHVRDVERDAQASRLAVVSDYVPGVRLSRLLTSAEQHLLPLDIESALCLIRQMLSAVATLHEATPDTWHGALAPERIVVTPDALVVVMEHVFGTALEQLEWAPHRYWSDLQIPLPPDKEQRFTRRGDVFQAGVVALSLLLGRPLKNSEYPGGLRDLASGTFGLGGGFEPMPEWLKFWLSRALWLDSPRAFKSAAEARQAFEAGLVQSGARASQSALESFLAQYESLGCGQTDDVSEVAVAVVSPPQSGAGRPTIALADDAQEPAGDETPVHPLASESASGILLKVTERDETLWHWRTGRLIVASAIAVALTSGGVIATRRYWVPPAGPLTGRLTVQSNPTGAKVIIDGRDRGLTPLTLTLSTGAHALSLSLNGAQRTIPLTISAEAEVSQFVEMPTVAPLVGQLEVRTDPPGAKVSVDGQRKGTSPVTVGDLTAGSHVVLLENELGSVSETVTVEAGATAALVVPLRAPNGAPVSGWLSISVPVEVQVLEDQKLIGSSKADRIMMATGRHQLEFVNEALGYRWSHDVEIAPGRVATVAPDWPEGTIAINAVPWANVWLDGQQLGETPVGNTAVAIGTHEVIFRHPQFGEQRYSATVTATAPTRLSVDMRKP